MKHIATAVLFLTGVLLASSIRAQSDDSSPSDVTGESCVALLQDDPALKPLSGKLSFDLTKTQALSILGSRTKSNTKEKAALTHFSLEWEKCHNSRVRFKVMWLPDWPVYMKFAANRLSTDGLHD